MSAAHKETFTYCLKIRRKLHSKTVLYSAVCLKYFRKESGEVMFSEIYLFE